MTRSFSVSSVLAALLVAVAAASPASADHDESSSQPPGADAMHDGSAPADANAFPSNDLSTSMASKVSTPAAPGGSLHVSPKILNDAGVSNDLKSALQPGPKAAAAPAATDNKAAPQPAPRPDSAGAPGAEPPAFDLEVAAPDASLPDAGGPVADGVPARRGAPGIFLPLIGVAALAAVGGLFAARLLRARGGAPSQE